MKACKECPILLVLSLSAESGSRQSASVLCTEAARAPTDAEGHFEKPQQDRRNPLHKSSRSSNGDALFNAVTLNAKSGKRFSVGTAAGLVRSKGELLLGALVCLALDTMLSGNKFGGASGV